MSLREAIGCGLMLLGALLALLAGLGLLRMPDLYTRMSATSKASTLGAALLVLGAALILGTEPAVARAIAVIAFVTLTAPVAAHRIARAGYVTGVRPWEGTHHDELRGRLGPEGDPTQRERDPDR
jgi:multicomponent Na+:H+ antiporter subunit G